MSKVHNHNEDIKLEHKHEHKHEEHYGCGCGHGHEHGGHIEGKEIGKIFLTAAFLVLSGTGRMLTSSWKICSLSNGS